MNLVTVAAVFIFWKFQMCVFTSWEFDLKIVANLNYALYLIKIY